MLPPRPYTCIHFKFKCVHIITKRDIEEANKEGGGRRSDEPTVIEGALHCTVHPFVELYSIHYY